MILLQAPTSGRLHLKHALERLCPAHYIVGTTLIVMTAWCGFFFRSEKGVSSIGSTLRHALMGIGMVSSDTAALNEMIERDVDRKDAPLGPATYSGGPHVSSPN